MKNLRTLLIVSGVLMVGVAVFFLALQLLEGDKSFRGSMIEPSPPAVDFQLGQADGTPFKLSEQKGRVVLIFFGYANCPDVCPTTMAEYKRIHSQLGDEASQVDFVFITVDPNRDTPEAIGEFVHAFDPSFIGLTGSMEELLPVWQGYWVGRQEPAHEASALDYEVNHVAYIYVVDKEGRLRLFFPYGQTAEDMTHDIRVLLAE